MALAACKLTQSFASGGCKPTLSAKEQQAYAVKYVLPFFEAITKSNSAAMTDLLSDLKGDAAKAATVYELDGCTSEASVIQV